MSENIGNVVAKIQKLRSYLDEFEKKLLQFSDVDQDIKREVDSCREGGLNRILQINDRDCQKIFAEKEFLNEIIQGSKGYIDADQIEKFGGLIDTVGKDVFFNDMRNFVARGGLVNLSEQDHVFLLAIVQAHTDDLMHRFENILQSTTLRIVHHTRELGYLNEMQKGFVDHLMRLRDDHGQVMGQ